MNIIMYSTSTCTTCGALEQWLAKNGHDYTKKITDEDPAAMAEFMAVNDGMIGVPFTVITADDGKQTKIIGYDRAQFQAAL
ncbi:MAG: glutaredoxin family protein [Candidatus Saccharimonadales bacterium]